jgi:hypothetical protein
MRAYTVHAPRIDPQPDRFVFVKDGFSWPALVIPFLWMLWHRMWLTLVGFLVFLAAVVGLSHVGADGEAVLIGLGGLLILGFEGNNLRRLSLRWRGFQEVGSAVGEDLEEAEIRFFNAWSDESRLQAGMIGGDGDGATTSDEPIFGLFPEPDVQR